MGKQVSVSGQHFHLKTADPFGCFGRLLSWSLSVGLGNRVCVVLNTEIEKWIEKQSECGEIPKVAATEDTKTAPQCVCRLLFPQNNAKVAVLGASGGIGQPLSLLLKNSPLVSRLTLYDIAHTPGVAADLSHIETRASVKGTAGCWRLPVFRGGALGCLWCLEVPVACEEESSQDPEAS